MEDLSVDLDYVSDVITQTELDEWLHTTDVFDQEVERLRPAPEDTAAPAQQPMRRDFDPIPSLEHGRPEKDMFGIDFPTAIRVADREAGAETHNSSVSSASSLCSKSQSQTSTYPQPVIDLTASEPAIIDLTTTDDLPQPPSPCKRARRTFDSNVNIEQMLTLMGKPSSSSVAATGTEERAHNLLESARSYPPTRRASVGSTDFINNWQKQSYQDSRRISLPESMPPSSSKDSSSPTSFFRDMDDHSSRIHRMMRRSSAVSHVGDDTNSISDSTIMSHRSCCNELPMAQTQQSRRMIMGALSGSTRSDDNNHVASGAHVAASSTSFFRDMDERSSRIHRMLSSSSSAVSHVGDDTNSISDIAIMSNRSCCNEFHDAMEQTQQSRRMIMGALSGSTRSDGNNHVASGAHVAATALKMPECGMQCGLGEVAGLPYPRPNSSDATGTRNVATKAEAEVKRNLECIAREQMILEKRLAEMYRGIGR